MSEPKNPERMSQLVKLILVILGVFLTIIAWYRLAS